jgi:hypothetical protein
MIFIATLLNLFTNKEVEQKEKFEPKWEKPIIGYGEGSLSSEDKTPLIGVGEPKYMKQDTEIMYGGGWNGATGRIAIEKMIEVNAPAKKTFKNPSINGSYNTAIGSEAGLKTECENKIIVN